MSLRPVERTREAPVTAVVEDTVKPMELIRFERARGGEVIVIYGI